MAYTSRSCQNHRQHSGGKKEKESWKKSSGVTDAPTRDARHLDDGNANMESLVATLMAKIDGKFDEFRREQSTHRPAATTQSTLCPAVTAQSTHGSVVTAQSTLGPVVTTQSTLGPAVTAQSTLGPAVTAQSTLGPAVTPQSTLCPAVTTQSTLGLA